VIETERVVIRLPETEDVPDIIRYYDANRAHLQPFSPAFEPGLFDEATWHDQVEIRAHEFAAREAMRAFLFPRQGHARILGNLNLSRVYRGVAQSCILGYNLAATEQGHGYMTEAVRAVVDFAFRDWNLHRVTAGYMPSNTRSAAVLARCGFEIEGHARSYLLINGRWEDHVLTAIINPSWVPPGQAP